ncbi:MAG: IS66 family insertion sequence element accessory protein TnpA [Janthinobacterium lividum]
MVGNPELEQDEFWRGHVDAFLRQRRSQRDYCQQHGIPARELRKWRTRFYGPVRHGARRSQALLRQRPA